MPPLPVFDCRRCGACCCNPDENRVEGYTDYIEVRRTDPIARNKELVRRFVVLNADGLPHMRMDARQRCAALRGTVGRSVECTIYDYRPSGCRKVTVGSEACLQARRERGLSTSPRR